ncbi:hypothetical protein BD414DRAFT_495412 [Trametes punicea]|nr:hypothetical protein BD414DRAFT_495412 [Trametes punicea]
MSRRAQHCPPVPGEVADAIIDHLYNDVATLRSCALVCSEWLFASRHHVCSTFKAIPEKFALTDLLHFLTSTPDVSVHIRRFIFSGYRGVSFRDIVAQCWQPNSATISRRWDSPFCHIIQLGKLFVVVHPGIAAPQLGR